MSSSLKRFSCLLSIVNIYYISNKLLIMVNIYSCKFEGDVNLLKVTGILTRIKACSLIYRLWRNDLCLIRMFIWSYPSLANCNTNLGKLVFYYNKIKIYYIIYYLIILYNDIIILHNYIIWLYIESNILIIYNYII